MTSLSSPVSTVTGPSPGCGCRGNESPAFLLPPRNTRVSVGGVANLEGRVRGHPEPQVTWLREGRAVIGGERCVVERGGRGYFSLKVGGVREEDAGPYTCQATNQEGSRQVTVEILLEDISMKTFFLSSSGKSGLWGESPPKFITKPSRLVAKLGESGKLIAKATGRPPPRVTWYKGEAELQSCGRVLIYERAGLHFLEIKEVSVGDAGSYSCLISNDAGNATAVTSLNIEGVPGESSSCSSVSSWRIKPPVQLPLEAVSRTAATPVQPVLSPDPERSVRDQRSSRVERRSNPRLEAPPLDQERREGSLQGRSRSKVTKVTEVRANQAPRFLYRLADLKVMDGSAVTMTVELTGLPPPEVVWFHDEQQVSETEDFHLLRDGTLCSLMIQEVFPEDTGMYSCRASNRLGEDRTQCRLTVEEPQDGVQPWFITKPKAVRAVQGQHVLLSCAVAGDPFPGCTWARAGRPLTSGGDYELLQKEDVISLLIRRVTDLHAGEYVITLRNQVGQCSAVACLSVTDGETDRSTGRETDRSTGRETDRSTGRETDSGRRGGGRGGGTVRGGEQQGSRVNRQEANEQQKKNLQQEEKTLLQKKKKKKKKEEEEEEDQKLHFSSFLGHGALKNNREEEEEEVREEERSRQNIIIMDFKANLKGVKKAEDRKAAAPQVDFRAVLGKKSGAKPAEKNVEEGIKKTSPEKNGEKMAENNCVDEGLKEKKAGGKMAPEFLEKLCDVTVIDGQILRLQCRLNASDPPSVTWTLDGKTIKPSKFIVLANEGGLCSLTIGKALPEDEGEYKCRAENSAGKSESCCMVLVDDPTENSISDKKKTKAPTSESEFPKYAAAASFLLSQ
ncbi:myosin light chain kinase, smooth muscle-like isoform X2 [Gymnodraco acuticeps]|uniref:Myosin light chain kinase, smooth muscle-like isoform X2 n=1 Tax=Gymnodraco acuticeps TaxID=8218 RepID=A0A6P8SPJ5_GYMAC|nr:myosin light chain kinase, smooth muscle-like isoform X2 [Gymnodraco acuticeps]